MGYPLAGEKWAYSGWGDPRNSLSGRHGFGLVFPWGSQIRLKHPHKHGEARLQGNTKGKSPLHEHSLIKKGERVFWGIKSSLPTNGSPQWREK